MKQNIYIYIYIGFSKKKKKKRKNIYGKHKRCLGLKLIMRFGQGVELKNEIRGKSIIWFFFF